VAIGSPCTDRSEARKPTRVWYQIHLTYILKRKQLQHGTPAEPQYRSPYSFRGKSLFIGGRWWDRTTDPCRVKAVLSRLANRPLLDALNKSFLSFSERNARQAQST